MIIQKSARKSLKLPLFSLSASVMKKLQCDNAHVWLPSCAVKLLPQGLDLVIRRSDIKPAYAQDQGHSSYSLQRKAYIFSSLEESINNHRSQIEDQRRS